MDNRVGRLFFQSGIVVGDQNKVADTLSCLGFQKETDDIIPKREASTMKGFAEETPLHCASTMCESLSMEKFKEEQSKDELLQQVCIEMKHGVKTLKYSKDLRRLMAENLHIYRQKIFFRECQLKTDCKLSY